MNRKIALLLLLATLPFASCDKIPSLKKKFTKQNTTATPTPVAEGAPEPAAVAGPATPIKPVEAAKPDVNTKASVMVLCYHRFEDRPRDSLAVNPGEFEKQMGALKEHGFTVIPMQDFLAWRRGEKSIADKSCVITIDDGYRSGYDVAWPILKKHSYPFTMFIYTNYVKGQPNAGGQSLSWEELEEMRDAGVDIQSHTVSHTNLRMKKGKYQSAYPTYEEWLRHEMVDSKKMLEQRLGISVNCLAYPYGNQNEEIRKIAMDAGYEVAFTVYGQRITYNSHADQLGRYAIESTKPKVFQDALAMVGGGGGFEGASAPSASVSMITQPMDGETINDPKPTIKANLETFGEVEPGSVIMFVSGLGSVPVKYDAGTKMAEAKITQALRPQAYTVILSAKVKGRKTETRWSFTFDPAAPPSGGVSGEAPPKPIDIPVADSPTAQPQPATPVAATPAPAAAKKKPAKR